MDNVDQNIARIEQIFGRTFSNKLLCAEALQMAGENVLIYVGEKECFVKKNKALESVGDTIIDAVLCKTWYGSLDNQGNRSSVGDWDKQIRQRLASNDNLARVGKAAGIDCCIIKNLGLPEPGPKMIARTVEAIIGAYYMDAGDDGINAARDVMTNLGLSLTVTSRDHPTP